MQLFYGDVILPLELALNEAKILRANLLEAQSRSAHDVRNVPVRDYAADVLVLDALGQRLLADIEIYRQAQKG